MGVWGGKPGPKCSLLSCSSHRIKNRSLEGGQRRPQRMGLPHRLGEAAREGQRLAKENAPDHKSAELGSEGGSTTSWLCVCDDWHVRAPTPKYTCGNPARPCHSVRRPLGGDWVVRVPPRALFPRPVMIPVTWLKPGTALTRTGLGWHPDLTHSASGNGRSQVCCSSATQCTRFCYSGPSEDRGLGKALTEL